jgi:hypothetical protein
MDIQKIHKYNRLLGKVPLAVCFQFAGFVIFGTAGFRGFNRNSDRIRYKAGILHQEQRPDEAPDIIPVLFV